MLNRRDFLLQMGAAGAVAVLPRRGIAAPLRDNPFTLGVAAGDPWPDGFVIWTRLAPAPLQPGSGMSDDTYEVAWEIAADERFRTIVRHGAALASPTMGHSVHVELTGLEAARPYWYRFTCAGHISPAGRARTAPTTMSDVARLRIGVGGCQNYEHGFFTAWQYLAGEDLDAVFHYGDYIYEGAAGRHAADIPVIRRHVGPEPMVVEDYRLRYALYKMDPDLQAAHASAAFLMTYDDHEIDNNWAGAQDQDGTDPATFLRRRHAGLRAWYENMPVRAAQLPTPEGMQMYRRLDYGRLLRVHLLDTRQHRDDQLCGESATKHCRDPATFAQGTILGDRAHDWLHQGLDAAFTWNLIAQQVVVMPYQSLAAEGARIGLDAWSGYPESRRRLVRAINEKRPGNVIIATGDVHQNMVGYLPLREEEPDRNQVATEFVCTSISSLGDGSDVKIRGGDWRAIVAENPNMLFINGQRGYQVFTLDADRWRTDIMKVDRVSDRSGRLSRLASFTVEAGSPLASQG